MMLVAPCIPFPFFALHDGLHTMLVCATRWLSMHLYTLAHSSMHESCLLVCRPCFNIMNLWIFDPNLHLSLVDTTFCLLFACLVAFLLLCLPCLSCLSALCLFHMLFASFPSIACLLVSCLCLCMYTYGARMLGARVESPRCRQKGHGCKHVDISQAAMFSSFRGSSPSYLVMYSFKTPSFLLPFSNRWVVLGISCHVPFVLVSRVWRPLFTFLHLYFGPCSRDVGIYFPALCASIVHDVCIYIPAPPSWCNFHSPCHLRQSDA